MANDDFWSKVEPVMPRMLDVGLADDSRVRWTFANGAVVDFGRQDESLPCLRGQGLFDPVMADDDAWLHAELNRVPRLLSLNTDNGRWTSARILLADGQVVEHVPKDDHDLLEFCTRHGVRLKLRGHPD